MSKDRGRFWVRGRGGAVWRSLAAVMSVWVAGYGADLYIDPFGQPAGPGTPEQPYSLGAALSGRVGRAGDTFWLREGTYRLGHLDTTVHGAPGAPITFRQMPGERARVDGSLTFFDSPGYVVLRDLELFSSDAQRISTQTNVGFNPTDLRLHSGIFCFVPNMSFINLVVHDHVRHGIYLSEAATNNLVYGCLVYNNGWVGPDNSSGHNFYIQNQRGAKVLAENIAFNGTAVNFQVFESRPGAGLVGVSLEGNVAFQAGALSTVRPSHDWIIGVDAPATGADGIVFKANRGYYSAGSSTIPYVQLGRAGTNGSLEVQGNYLPLGVDLHNWRRALFINNEIAPPTAGTIVNLDQTATALNAVWNDNGYGSGRAADRFVYNSNLISFSEWQAATGFDAQSVWSSSAASGVRVFLDPNRYEPGRAHIIVYNWDELDTVAVDVRSVLPAQSGFEVRNAQDFFGPTVASGVFDGQPLQLPMRGLTVAQPGGALPTPPPTGPRFNVFVLVPSSAARNPPLRPFLQISSEADRVLVSWPTNLGAYVLQQGAVEGSVAAEWREVQTRPVVVGAENVVTLSPLEASGFFRLKAPAVPDSH